MMYVAHTSHFCIIMWSDLTLLASCLGPAWKVGLPSSPFNLQKGLLCWMSLQRAWHAIPLVTGGVVTTWHNLQMPVSNLCWDLIEVGWVTVGLAYWLLPT